MERRNFLETEWSPKNEKSFSEYSNGSHFKAIWEHYCECGKKHEWKAVIKNRLRGDKCASCSGRKGKVCECKSLKELRPDLILEWSPKNIIDPKTVSIFSNKNIWWVCHLHKDCELKHEWKTDVAHRVQGTGCPYCSNQKICVCNSLSTLRPDLASQWSFRNNFSPQEIGAGGRISVWWECEKHDCPLKHEWKTTIDNRNRGNGCPYCLNKKICECNSLSKLRPWVLDYWHPTKNKLKPDQVSVFSHKKVWWKCDRSQCDHSHEWKSIISSVSQGKSNCPYCSGRQICVCNSLLKLRPQIANEWHPDKNKLKPEEVSLFSNEKIWWICDKKHKWITSVGHRTRKNGTNCPVCASSKGEKAVKEVLEKLNIKYVPQKTIYPKTDLRLYLDFYLPDHNLAIEFDGGQHFFPVAYFGGQKTFERLQLNDAHKNLYCIENGISLLRIHHSEAEEIEKIVRQAITFYGQNGPWLFLSGLHPKF